MASTASPHGARPVGSLVSCAYNAKLHTTKLKMLLVQIFFMEIL